MDEQGCPRCKTTKYRNPSLKLLVNVCGHSLCESCVEMLFIKGSGACPECGTALRRNNYRLQVFEDAFVEKEVDIRKRILKDFNKKEDDFDSLQAYNDYLEMIETIIFNLANGVETESTRKMIEQYKKENKDLIKKNQSKMTRDEEYLEHLIEQEQHEAAMRRQLVTEEEQREKTLKRRNKDALIDELMFSDMPAHKILATHKQTTAVKEEEVKAAHTTATTFSTGIRIQGVFKPSGDQADENQPYVHVPMQVEACGPAFSSLKSIMEDGYLSNVRCSTDAERAGGFQAHVACQRALQDAFCGLFYFPAVSKSPPSSSTLSFSQGSAHSPMCLS